MMPGSRHSSRFFILLLLLALVLAGCAGLGKRLEPPRITLTHIQVQQIKVFETIFQIELRVLNTNEVAMEIKGLHCDIEINDNKFASGVSNKKTRISPYDTATIPVTVYSSVLDLVQGLIDSSTKEKVKYKLKGRLSLGGAVPSTVPFESEGQFSLPGPTGTRAENIP
jgi:LEA14-like dessication related protein